MKLFNNIQNSIAFRYLWSKKSTNVINIISFVSVLGIAVGVMALLSVLTFFNGLETLIIGLYDTFNPDIKIESKLGKTFVLSSAQNNKLKANNKIAYYSNVLDETALLRYDNKNYYATVKGVDKSFENVSNIKKSIIRGKYILNKDSIQYALLGLGVENALGVNTFDEFNSIQVYFPNRRATVGSLEFTQAFSMTNIYPAATFSIQNDFDNKYVIVQLQVLQNLLNYSNNEIDALEIKVKNKKDIQSVKNSLKQLFGASFTVKDAYEQEATFYKIMKAEKWAIFAILTLILIISAFNMIGSLTILVMEKKHDIFILQSLGMNHHSVQKIFIKVGWLIAFFGFCLGIILTFLIYGIQKYFKLLKLSGNGGFVVDAYPVELRVLDFIIVAILVFIIVSIASYFPSKKILTYNK